jgi:hypothetical protein
LVTYLDTQNDPENYSELLEAADLFVYVCSHALSPNNCRQKEFFEAMYKKCHPLLACLLYEHEEHTGGKRTVSILRTRHEYICGKRQ